MPHELKGTEHILKISYGGLYTDQEEQKLLIQFLGYLERRKSSVRRWRICYTAISITTEHISVNIEQI
jgi:hypothetical protein